MAWTCMLHAAAEAIDAPSFGLQQNCRLAGRIEDSASEPPIVLLLRPTNDDDGDSISIRQCFAPHLRHRLCVASEGWFGL